jgi:hypothetical protein
LRFCLRQKTKRNQDKYPVFRTFPADYFDLAISDATGAKKQSEEIIEFLYFATVAALKIEFECLGVFYDSPVALTLFVFIPGVVQREIGSDTLTVRAFLKDGKAELLVDHCPSMLTFCHHY